MVALASALALGPARVAPARTTSYRTYAAYTDAQRRHAPIDGLGCPATSSTSTASTSCRGDRVYFQVLRERLQPVPRPADRPFRSRAASTCCPAVQATDLKDATVVVSYFEDPKLLHVRFITQQRAGLQPIFVSRIRAP